MTMRSERPTRRSVRVLTSCLATSLVATASVSSSLCHTTHAFVTSGATLIPTKTRARVISSIRSPSSFATTKTTSMMTMMNWDEILYHAENTASVFARQSLDNDPRANLWAALPVMYGAGLLTSISPCVWGLLPLTMSYISTAAGEREDRDATLPTLFFAAGLASVFCTLGIVAATVGGVVFGSSGGSDGSSSVSGVAVTLLSSGVCLAMGLQLLDFVQLPLLDMRRLSMSPRSASSSVLQQDELLLDSTGAVIRTDASTTDHQQLQQQQQGSLIRTFLLGGSSALVASPCATPVLTSILAYVANANDPLLGAILLFGYTLGYSTPLLAVAATGGQALANLKGDDGGVYAKLGPWVSPLTGGILLWYGTNGLLTSVFGDPSLAGLGPMVLE